mmetsp:Transcript_38048/g.89014  ORF Transcript_38048/g.89014 Transcript_38048/m.89014 type:complete len:720 (+) Transcript_38048:64-2223(+)
MEDSNSPDSNGEMPRLNFKRLMQEFTAIKRLIPKGAEQIGGVTACGPVEDSLLEWEVQMIFPAESKLQQSLEELHAREYLGAVEDSHDRRTPATLTLRVRFPIEFPNAPPEVWIRRPRLKHHAGAPVSFGGRLCFPLLSGSGWTPSSTMQSVFKVVQEGLLVEGTEVDNTAPFAQHYKASPSLERLKSVLFPTANGFDKKGLKVISPATAATFLGDMSRLEATDKIALPFEYAQEIYAPMQRGANLQLPLIFEVKTEVGRKCHCAIFDFVNGVPPGHVLLPQWVMQDLFVEDYATVSVRGVVLPLISFVKVQPHSVDFYRAVQESSVDVTSLLTQSLARFSALTEDTCVPIEVNGKPFDMQVLQLEPKGAVRIIDCDVQHHFEFKVDFEPAPNLEDESATKERQDRIFGQLKAKREAKERAQKENEIKRREGVKLHFEKVLEDTCARASQHTSSSTNGVAAVDMMLRFPDGSSQSLSCHEGEPILVVLAAALRSEWATAATPWGIRLLGDFPTRRLSETELITQGFHRSRIGIQEESAPEDDETLLELVNSTRVSTAAAPQPPAETAIASGGPREGESSATPEDFVPLPPMLDRSVSHVQRRTEEAFEVQRWMLSGLSREEAESRFRRGEVLPAAPPEPPPPALHRHSTSAQTASTGGLTRTFSQEEERARQVQDVINFTAQDYPEALAALEAADWNTELAITSLLDQGGQWQDSSEED